MVRFLIAVVCIAQIFSIRSSGQNSQSEFALVNKEIGTKISVNGMVSLSDPADLFKANVIGDRTWFRTKLFTRKGDGDWVDSYRDSSMTIKGNSNSVSIVLNSSDLVYEQRYSLNEKGIDLEMMLESKSPDPVTIGDLALYMPWRRASGEKPEYIFEQCFTKHHFLSGNGSFLIFTKPSGNGPFLLVMTDKNTGLEFFDDTQGGYKVYIHSARSASLLEKGTWRQKNTSLTLGTAGSSNSKIKYGLKLRWVNTWDEIRQTLFDEGLADIRVVPGMTVPSDLSAQFSIHTKNVIDSIAPEFPGKTTLKYLGEKQPGHFVYDVSFKKLGENMLTVYYAGGTKTHLEFFSTEPLETLIKKRSAFIVNSTQHRDTSKWYNGLFSLYDMKAGVLRGPDNTDGHDGWYGYVLASDDPGLAKAPYVAAKNVYFPDDKEIAAVEYYLEEYVWDGLQRTDMDDPYPYGVYGVPNWKVARDTAERRKIESSNLDKMKIWRSYDYPHVAMLYYHMYEIAKMYPDKVKYLDAAGYLERAFQTAKAFYKYPYEILPWYDTYKWGCYNELVIEKLIRDLDLEGRGEDASWLRGEYEKKVKYFVYDDKYPYRSEYAIDRTAFESSYAFAKYGSLYEMKPDENLWFDRKLEKWYSHPVVRREDARAFMDRQHFAGLAVRGWLETSYNLLGADFTHSSDNHGLSYMAKMGGWAILDYGVNFSEKPYDWLQLGYASYLSSWALMNTGTEESDYGYWSPGKENDGAMGWTFMYPKWGTTKNTWLRKDRERGAYNYDGEADLGLGATFRMAATVLTDDPLFGWIALGGTKAETKSEFLIVPRDGVRNRFSVATTDLRFTIEFNRDGFAKDTDIKVDKKLSRIAFRIENRAGTSHTTRVTFITLPGQKVKVKVDGKAVQTTSVGERELVADIKISNVTHSVVVELFNY